MTVVPFTVGLREVVFEEDIPYLSQSTKRGEPDLLHSLEGYLRVWANALISYERHLATQRPKWVEPHQRWHWSSPAEVAEAKAEHEKAVTRWENTRAQRERAISEAQQNVDKAARAVRLRHAHMVKAGLDLERHQEALEALMRADGVEPPLRPTN